MGVKSNIDRGACLSVVLSFYGVTRFLSGNDQESGFLWPVLPHFMHLPPPANP
jgi:hypothetical protein